MIVYSLYYRALLEELVPSLPELLISNAHSLVDELTDLMYCMVEHFQFILCS